MTTPMQILTTPSSRHKLHSDFFLGPPLLPNYQVLPVSTLDSISHTPDNQELDDGLLPNQKSLTTIVSSSLLNTKYNFGKLPLLLIVLVKEVTIYLLGYDN